MSVMKLNAFSWGSGRQQLAELLQALKAVRDGDFSVRIDMSGVGIMKEIADAFNEVVALNGQITGELVRINTMVGLEGNMDERASMGDVSGGWKTGVDSINSLVVNLAQPTAETARVLTAVARGDLSRKMALEIDGRQLQGEFLRIGNVVNTMVDQLSGFASEVTRVAREVGTEGKLGGQGEVPGVSGVWKDLTDSVNAMAGSLTSQVRNIAEVTTAVAQGDLSKKITVEASGEILELKDTINRMVDNLNTFAGEVTRVAREVGTEGKLGGQAVVPGVSGVWKDLTDNVNAMAGSLTSQVRNIAEVTTAVAQGDLSKKITVEASGEILELKDTINRMVDQLNAFGSEVTRVAREVGTDGKLGGQAQVLGVSGVWKDLTDSVNRMANNLTDQVRNIALVTTAVANGDLSQKVTVDVSGEILELKDTINRMVDQLNGFAGEVTRVAREVGTEGKLGGQGQVPGVAGVWKDLTDSVNAMASSLTSQVRNIAEVTTAVAQGDLSKKITVEASGEILELKDTINRMVDQLNAFGSEVTRVAREVGTDGKLGGQAQVPGVSGVWKDLTDSVNRMASNLTDQVRNIAVVTTAVANGDLSQKITVEASGEILELKDTINRMVDQLNAFGSEVTRVAREVGTEGKLGGQGQVPGVSGVWKDLTDNVNAMAASLTSQVRNIAEVTTAVAGGDLSKKITVEASGEILELKDTINSMVDNLNTFAGEVTRVAWEVGTEGKLGGQPVVLGVSGVWKDLTESVNAMAGSLTSQVRNIAEVTTAVAQGDLSKKITVEASGEILELKDTINRMVDQLNAFAGEVTRVAREVGTDGKLGGQGEVPGVSGVWKDLTDSVNRMASNLTDQVRNIAVVTTAVANGDLSQKITVEASGEILELKDTINRMVDQLNAFAGEVTRVAREVGTDGKLGGQAQVLGVSGVWKDLTDSVNRMANNLTDQVRNIALVTTAVANGDLSRKITVEASGEILQLKDTINRMVDQLNAFAGEVTRVAREVGTDGKLGGQGEVPGVAGVWKDLTDNVNAMAASLTSQVRDIARVTMAVANGDLSQKITVEARGEILQLKDTINRMVDQLNAFGAEVTRVAREVGTDGKLGGQAEVPGVAGVWKDLTDNVNAMAGSLTSQVRDIAKVTTAVANGDLSRQITVEAKGEILELKNTINRMVDQLNAFAGEVTRVAREVGTEGKLGGQAQLVGVAGVGEELTDNVNAMAGSLTSQVRDIAKVTMAVANGDLSQKITVEARGEILELKDTINKMVDQLNAFASEVTRVAREVGTEGKLGGQAYVRGVSGVWKDLTDNVNQMASNLTDQVRNIALVTTAVANGDLSQKITVEARGEILQLKNTINKMVDQLNAFGSEVTRVAREVGTDGKLGGQAQVPGVAGIWKDLTDSVNAMAGALTSQVRDIAKVTIAVANGDLSQKITVEARGEILELKDTINKMVDQLNAFAGEVTRVAREVGTDGKLGGQAQVKGVSGVWKDLTDNVNQLAGNLTLQVRAIADVATAVSRGDLSRSITVEAFGEVAELKDNVNRMIITLRDTTRRNEEQDWLKTNLAKFSRTLQGERNLETVTQLVMSELTPLVNGHQSVFYIMDIDEEEDERSPVLKLLSTYAYVERKNVANRWKLGAGLVGQCAREKKAILLTNVPDDYIKVTSGLGESKPMNIIVLPVIFEGQVLAVVEIASFDRFKETHLTFLEQLMESLGVVLNVIQANMRTEELLKQSQQLAEELQTRQEDLKRSNVELEEQAQALKQSQEQLRSQREELRQTNDELEDKAKKLEEQKQMVEVKNSELELTQASLEEKAEQLAITSKYKSEFLANMSHELRTPLNSLLLLTGLLGENRDGNLLPHQVEHISTVHTSGNDLLGLINEILDLSKIEAGRMDINITASSPMDVKVFAERTFQQLAEQKGIEYGINIGETLPQTIRTDRQRLEQILRNLLSNAFKFTEKGSVTLDIGSPEPGMQFESQTLRHTDKVIAFTVKDTGIGIPKDKQKIIWEAFQQLDGTTSRKYGGTGLGLTISREIAKLLGGEIHLESEEGAGCTFTLFLPARFVPTVSAEPVPELWQRAAERTAPGRKDGGNGKDEEPIYYEGGAEILPAYEVMDDRYDIHIGDRVVLIIEDDENFASILKDMAHERDLKAIVTLRGDTGLALAHEYKPDAILLDILLPMLDGWTILERLKGHPDLRHIPVHIISGTDDERKKAISRGAFTYLTKPVDKQVLDNIFNQLQESIERKISRLLVVEGDETEREVIVSLIGGEDVEVTAVETGEQAFEAMQGCTFDCMVLGLALPDMSGAELLEKMAGNLDYADMPIIVYCSRNPGEKDRSRINEYADRIILKGDDSQARLLDETALFLNRAVSELPEDKRLLLNRIREREKILAGRKILIVDDDVRNIFALTSVLESRGMKIAFAENGKEGIVSLKADPEIDLVLMDIMMPELDGYETIRQIREDEKYQSLPIVALTAKAMKGDREKCIEAGASDYISKPVNAERLLSLLQVWLYRSEQPCEIHCAQQTD